MVLPANYQPVILDKWLHVAQMGFPAVTKAIVGRYGMSPKIIVIHIQEGSNFGSWEHFHVVQASATVLIGKNGEIWRLVPENWGPWTNGDVQSPTAKGWEVINKWGADPNAYTLSIETEGFTGEFPKTEAQMNAVIWQVADWKARYNIEQVYVIRHADINSVTRPNCPGNPYFQALTTALSATAIDVKPTYGTVNKIMVNGKMWDGTGDVTVNNRHFFGLNGPLKVKARVDGVDAHVYATRSSALTRQSLTQGEEFTVIGWCRGEEVNGDDRWWITKYHSRIDVNGTDAKPPTSPTVVIPPKPDNPEGTITQNGRVYFPAMHGGNQFHDLVVLRKANLRAGASLKAKVVGTVAKGDTVRALYWCLGGEVHEQRAWWILDPGNGLDPIKHGPRLWASATNTAPEVSVDKQ